MQHYVLLGATGHLGNVILDKLVKAKKGKITCLSRATSNMAIYENYKDVEVKIGDVRDLEFLRANISSGDIVINSSGIIDINSMKNPYMHDINVNGANAVATVCLEKKVKKLVYTSSVHIIDPYENKGALLEPTNFEPDKLVGAYSRSKCEATRFVFEKAKEGLNVSVVYPSGIIGPHDIKVSKMGQVFIDYINGKLPAIIKGEYNFVDVRDCADGVIAATEKGRAGEGYLLTGQVIGVQDMIRLYSQKTGRKMLVKMPLWIAKFVSYFALFFAKLAKKEAVFCPYSIEVINTNCAFDNSKAKKELGFKERDVKQSLLDGANWLLENKKEKFKPKNYAKVMEFIKQNEQKN